METLTKTGYQQTSLFAYIEVKPTLGDKQKIVYEALKKFDHMSNQEIAEYLGWEINSITPRVLELRKMGYVREWGEVKNKQGRAVKAWEIMK